MNLFQALLAITAKVNAQSQGKAIRKGLLGLGASLRKSPADITDMIAGITYVATFVENENASWTNGDKVVPGSRFDTCDLRAWLDIAQHAGVPHVPAREILRLSEDELGMLTGPVHMPRFIQSAIARGLAKIAPSIASDTPQTTTPRIDAERLIDSLSNAMDNVPEGWMVRSHICGPSTLKTYAGAGLADPMVSGVDMSSDLSVGPGWVRNGNRRRIDATDARYVELFPQGHGSHIAYLARPWVQARPCHPGTYVRPCHSSTPLSSRHPCTPPVQAPTDYF